MERIGEANEQLRVTAELDDLKGRELVIALVDLMARTTLEHAGILRVFMYRAIGNPAQVLGTARTESGSPGGARRQPGDRAAGRCKHGGNRRFNGRRA